MNNTLNINKANALDAFRNADAKSKELLKRLFGTDVFSENVMDRVKSLDDALAETGRPNTPEFADVPEDLRPYFKAQYNAIVITEALNEGWKADFKDGNQKKWLPWFNSTSPAGFSFHDTYYGNSNPNAGHAAHLCSIKRTNGLAPWRKT